MHLQCSQSSYHPPGLQGRPMAIQLTHYITLIYLEGVPLHIRTFTLYPWPAPLAPLPTAHTHLATLTPTPNAHVHTATVPNIRIRRPSQPLRWKLTVLCESTHCLWLCWLGHRLTCDVRPAIACAPRLPASIGERFIVTQCCRQFVCTPLQWRAVPKPRSSVCHDKGAGDFTPRIRR
jgi:hypothetical protein